MTHDRHEFLFLDEVFTGHTPKRVLDLGANAGLASSYFAARWPDAQVAAVEPSKLNFAMAVLNTMDSRNVRLFLGGIWDRPAKLTVRYGPTYGPDELAEWGFAVVELTTETMANMTIDDIVPAYTVPDIMDTMGWDYIDYMKIDVECAEFQLFNNTSSIPRPWLDRVGCLSIELHRWCPDKDHRSVISTLDSAGFQFKGRFGELKIWCRPDNEREAAATAYMKQMASKMQLSSSGSSGGGGRNVPNPFICSMSCREWVLSMALMIAGVLVLVLLALHSCAPVAAKVRRRL
jgi:FkbM family methyltransferase